MSTFLYFSSAQIPNISPSFSGMWMSTTGAQRNVLTPIPDQVVPAVGSTINLGVNAGFIALDRQYISPGLADNQTINGLYSGQLMVREFATTDNVDIVMLCAKVVSNDGSTLRGTLINSGNYGPVAEFVNNASLRNKTIASGQTLTTVNALRGDRIVLEIGYQDSAGGTTPQAGAGWGSSAPRLPVNETSTTNGAGWLLITPTLRFNTTSFSSFSEDNF